MAEIFDKILTGFNKGVKVIKTTSDTALESADLRRQISTLEKSKKEMLLNSGSIAYNIYKSGELLDDRLTSVFSEIDSCCNQINALNLKIEEIARAKNAAPAPEQTSAIQNGKKCPECGTVNAAEAKFCGSCGHGLSAVEVETEKGSAAPPENLCPSCGAKNKDGARFCCHCGTSLT